MYNQNNYIGISITDIVKKILLMFDYIDFAKTKLKIIEIFILSLSKKKGFI